MHFFGRRDFARAPTAFCPRSSFLFVFIGRFLWFFYYVFYVVVPGGKLEGVVVVATAGAWRFRGPRKEAKCASTSSKIWSTRSTSPRRRLCAARFSSRAARSSRLSEAVIAAVDRNEKGTEADGSKEEEEGTGVVMAVVGGADGKGTMDGSGRRAVCAAGVRFARAGDPR